MVMAEFMVIVLLLPFAQSMADKTEPIQVILMGVMFFILSKLFFDFGKRSEGTTTPPGNDNNDDEGI